MQHLQQLANQRANQERVLNAAHQAQLSEATQDFEDTARRVNEQHTVRRRELEAQFAAANQAAVDALAQGEREAALAHQRRLK